MYDNISHSVRSFIEINLYKEYEPLRTTVMRAGGTGKSYLINTICTMINELTQSNEIVKVDAPRITLVDARYIYYLGLILVHHG